eukprot:2049776-Prymnesium_polylepis.2
MRLSIDRRTAQKLKRSFGTGMSADAPVAPMEDESKIDGLSDDDEGAPSAAPPAVAPATAASESGGAGKRQRTGEERDALLPSQEAPAFQPLPQGEPQRVNVLDRSTPVKTEVKKQWKEWNPGKKVAPPSRNKDTGFTTVLEKLYQDLGAQERTDLPMLRLMKRAIRVNLRYKVRTYSGLRKKTEKLLDKEKVRVRSQQAFDYNTSGAQESDLYSIYTKLSEKLDIQSKSIETFRLIENKAIDLLNEENTDKTGLTVDDKLILKKRDILRSKLAGLVIFSSSLIIDTVAEIVLAFYKNPYYIRNKFMNFLFAGPAGTGKTTIAKRIAEVFVASGLYVFDDVVEGSRSDLVSGYLGQSALKTTDLFLSGLDSGVIFIDEAYSLTQWEEGKLDQYGAEATNTLVDLMTKYKGLYCVMVAGYELEMRRYFLDANPGLPRRFPYAFTLDDYDTSELLRIYKVTLLSEQKLPLADTGPKGGTEADQFFNKGAWEFLRIVVDASLVKSIEVSTEEVYDTKTRKSYDNVKRVVPKNPFMYK